MARALFRNKNTICLDEPTSSLDKKTANNVIKQIIQEFNKSKIICISHEVDQLKLFDKILIFKKGKLVDEGNYEYLSRESEIFQNMISLV